MVPVNFSVSSQGNATWVILATTSTRRRSRKILFAARGGEDLARKYILGLVSVITVISSYLDFKGYSAVPD